jgi:fumarate reductase subunit D
MKFRELWLVLNFLGFVFGTILAISHPEQTTIVMLSILPLTASVWIGIKSYVAVSYLCVAACWIGSLLCGYKAGGKQSAPVEPVWLLPSAILLLVGASATYGEHILFMLRGLVGLYIIGCSYILLVGGIHNLIEDIEEGKLVPVARRGSRHLHDRLAPYFSGEWNGKKEQESQKKQTSSW